MTDILADTKRHLDEARTMLRKVKAGTPLARNLTQDDAIRILEENIALYERILRRYGWRDA